MANPPVQEIPGDERNIRPGPGIGLCLSGGGYRAMMFHLGSLWRLYEAGVLAKVDRISSVSGGSITAAVLALQWSSLQFTPGDAGDFARLVAQPLRVLAGETIDAEAVILGLALPGSVSDRVSAAYSRYLFGSATLQDLPDHPRFVINSTNVQSGALWRFMKPYMRDYRVGEVKDPTVPLAVAVAASSAFPPVLSPLELRLDPSHFTPDSGMDLQRPPFTTKAVLTDGGVYDNLGLETVWKRYETVLVSDGGGKMAAEEEPKADWGRHAYRVLGIIDNQVRSLRVRQLIDSYLARERNGAYWGIRTDIQSYDLDTALPCPLGRTTELAHLPTRLKRLDDGLQQRLINWGYAVCDAALRKHGDSALPAPGDFPYPASGV
jgi:NTE family protein